MNKNKEYMTGKEIEVYFKKLNLRTPLGFVLEYAKTYSVKEMLYKAVALDEDHYLYNKPKKKQVKKGRPFGYKVTAETKKKLRKAHTGKKLSEETKKKLSIAKTGVPRTPEVYARQLEWLKGHAPASTEAKQTIRMNQPHRNTIMCVQTGLYFASSSEASKWLVKNNSCSPQVRVALNRNINYKGLKFIKVDKESIPENKMWRSIDNPNWRGYLTEHETAKEFRHE